METMTDTKKVIQLLKQVKEEKQLSFDKILLMIEANGSYLSKSTLSRVFADGSEETAFRYETTIRPIAEALLDMENIETEDSTDTKAYKAILKLKKDLIDELQASNADMEHKLNAEKLKYHEKLEKETKHFSDSLSFMSRQIELKDQRIDALLATTTELMTTNNKLVKQLMECPLRKCDED